MPLNVATLWVETFAYTNGALTPRGGWTTAGGTTSHNVLGNLLRNNPSSSTWGNEIDLTGRGWGDGGTTWRLTFSLLPSAVADQILGISLQANGDNGGLEVFLDFQAGWFAGSQVDDIFVDCAGNTFSTGPLAWSASTHQITIEVSPTTTNVYLDAVLIATVATGDLGTMETVKILTTDNGDIARYDDVVLTQSP